MGEKTVSRGLFRKLSALRATLTDEEQLLLDSLVVGDYQMANHGTSALKKAVRRPAPDEAQIAPPLASSDAERRIRITFDQELELYILE